MRRRTFSAAFGRLLGLATALVVAVSAVPACSSPEGPSNAQPAKCTTAGVVSGEKPWSTGPGWSRVFFDDFDRCELGNDWSAYSGKPGGNPIGEWSPSMVSVQDGVLRLSAEKTAAGWRTGGVSNWATTQLFGRWEVRLRAERSADTSYHALLWPKNEQWPPEIDFAESVSPNRDTMSAFLHWRKPSGGNAKAESWTRGTFTDWHTVGVEWLPGVVRYYLDGRVWAEARSWNAVPNTPMWMAIQSEAGSCERRVDWGMPPCGPGDPRPTKSAVEVDWVVVYKPATDIYQNVSKDKLVAPTPGAQQLDVD